MRVVRETLEMTSGDRREEVAKAYRTLGLNPGASKEEIRAAYLREIRRNHPDRVSVDQREQASRKTAEINGAYGLLWEEGPIWEESPMPGSSSGPQQEPAQQPPPPAQPVGSQSRWPVVILAGVLVVAAVIGGRTLWESTRNDAHTVPVLVGATGESARDLLEALGWTVEERFDRLDGTVEGEVLATWPVGGTSLELSETVVLVVSLGGTSLETAASPTPAPKHRFGRAKETSLMSVCPNPQNMTGLEAKESNWLSCQRMVEEVVCQVPYPGCRAGFASSGILRDCTYEDVKNWIEIRVFDDPEWPLFIEENCGEVWVDLSE